MTTNVAFIIIFYSNLIRTTKDENECNIHNRLLCKGTKVRNRQRKKKVDVHFLATNAHVIFQSNIFCNTTVVTSFAATLQHCFCSNVFCSIFSTYPLQHCFLQQCFNTASITLSSTTSLQHSLCNIVFCNIASTPFLLLSGGEVQGFGGVEVGSWGLKFEMLGQLNRFF